MKYVIYDNTDNSMKPYISTGSESFSNTGDLESAMSFDSEKEAQDFIERSEWTEWAFVMALDED